MALVPFVKEDGAQPQQLLNGLVNRPHEFALLASQRKRDEKPFWKGPLS